MERYKNLSGGSSIAYFEIGDEWIKVQFDDGHIYLYNYARPGKNHIEKMKLLAVSGHGLNTYINNYVRGQYAGKN